ncbi:MAG: DUF4965 domain-containing protein [Clostridia bacterium]|nr:DUF4965 domain-containing protein [Clostridia bacterium]
MKLRPPAYPLITVDPYFSVWSATDRLTDSQTIHWTGAENAILGVATIDGKEYQIIGKGEIPAMKQTAADCTAFSTAYTFEQDGVRLTLTFTSPLIPNDLYLLTRPVSYLEIKNASLDGKAHSVSVKLSVSEEICMNKAGDDEISRDILALEGINSISMGRKNPKMLERSGDNLRIEWGRFYLSGAGKVFTEKKDSMTFACINAEVKDSTLVTFAYDDVKSIEYFGKHISSYWNKNGESILNEIIKAHSDYATTVKRCRSLENELFADAVRAGGEKYAEMLELALRQTLAAHKLVLDENGEVLYVSKECFSNGCAATVDVSYPSVPLFLIYNPELVKGMMRPIYKYARSDAWKFDFAPHDVGQYPKLNGQVYGNNALERQMPVEECGNMLIMEAAVAIATGDASFAAEHMDVLDVWVKYLIDNGRDPANQLCTDDFAGHLAHNCNLSLKAIMGIAGYGILKGMSGNKQDEEKYVSMARDMAKDWAERAANGDGSYRLAFDKPDTFSMKYNIVWDKLWGTRIMPQEVIASEVASYFGKLNAYGLPLDNRRSYTKSDWTVWTATLARRREDFERLIEPMWAAYNASESRVPMTDWYYTVTALHAAYMSKGENIEKSFRNRTVQGGLYVKLLEYKGIMKYM